MDCSAARKKQSLYTFGEARRVARYHGFESKEEFLEYNCPGAYQLPKNPHEGRAIARELNLASQQEYLTLFEQKQIQDDDPASLLPYRPDLKYKAEWLGWEDWLGCQKPPSQTTVPESVAQRIQC
eukprot:scaffold1390_cov138-Cylindrotheca_fusiformis.AAC.26